MKDIKYLDLLSVCDGCLCSSRDELDGVSDEKVFENIFAFNTLVPVVPRALAQFFFRFCLTVSNVSTLIIRLYKRCGLPKMLLFCVSPLFKRLHTFLGHVPLSNGFCTKRLSIEH